MNEFRPHPLLRNGHLQTVVGALMTGSLPAYRAVRHSTTLSDGEGLVVHEEHREDLPPDATIAILVHGLGGDHSSPYLRRIAAALADNSIRTWRVDLRGCGAGLDVAYKPAHAGTSEDLGHAIQLAHRLYPNAKVIPAAFSLGGNILLKLLGELGSGRCQLEIDTQRIPLAISVAPPSDLHSCCDNMERFSRLPYTRYYLKMLAKQVNLRAAKWDAWRSIVPKAQPRTIREFDHLYTAPLGGFTCTDEYYTRSSSAPWLPHIAIPTKLLIDRDDPIIPFETLEQVNVSDKVEKIFTRYGGHLGYLARQPRSTKVLRWMDAWVVEQICSIEAGA